jgi:hypothetical protein
MRTALRSGPRPAGLLLGLALAASAVADPLHAQIPASRDTDRCVSFDLGADHWAVDALRRLEGLGRVNTHAPKGAVPACTVGQLLEAAARAETGGELDPLLSAWVAAFEREFPRLRQGRPDARWPVLAAGSAEVGVTGRRGAGSPGRGEFPPDRTGTALLSDRTGGNAELEVGGHLLPRLSAIGRGGIDADGLEVSRLEAVTGVGAINLTAGRGSVGYGYARGGAIVLSDVAPLDRVEIATTHPLTLPARLGTFAFSSFFGRIREERHPGNPYLWGGSASLKPHPRFTLGIHRAAMFGGDDENYPVTAERVLNMLIGRVAGVGFEDQVVSVEGVLRLPTERVLPLTFHLEWGAEDAAGAWWDVPGRILGLYVPAVPSLPALSAGVERTSFQASCCNNPEWFRHWSFPGSWVLADRPLAHPLGGNGREWRAYVDLQEPRSGIRAESAAFRRWRGPENLFVPGREGTSWGGDARVRWRSPAGFELFGSLAIERGGGWDESGFLAGGRLLLP